MGCFVQMTMETTGSPRDAKNSSIASHRIRPALSTPETEKGEILRSDDDGNTWKHFSFVVKKNFRSLAVDSKGRIFAFLWGKGTYRTDDGGRSWISLHIHNKIVVGPKDVLISMNSGNGLFKSTDSGDHWKKIYLKIDNRFREGKACYEDLTVSNNGDILAGTSDGVFVSRDCGEHWARYNALFPYDDWASVMGISCSPNGMIAVGSVDRVLCGVPKKSN